MESDKQRPEEERRISPRVKATRELCLFASSELFYIASLPRKEAHTIRLLAITRDMSASGMAVIIPSLRLNEQRCGDEALTATIQMELPVGTIKLEFHPVRYEPIDQSDPHKGYIIGGRISSREGSDYDGYLKFLDGIQNSSV